MVANNANSSTKMVWCWLGDEWRLAQDLVSLSIEWKIMGSCHPDWCMMYLIKSDRKLVSLIAEAIWEVMNVPSISREVVYPVEGIYSVGDASRHWGHVWVDPASWSQSQYSFAFQGRLLYSVSLSWWLLICSGSTPNLCLAIIPLAICNRSYSGARVPPEPWWCQVWMWLIRAILSMRAPIQCWAEIGSPAVERTASSASILPTSATHFSQD